MLAGGLADDDIVAADELRIAIGLDIAIEHDDRDLGIDRLLDDAGEAGGFLGRDEERVDLLADQVLDVGDLLLGAVLAVGDDELDLGVLLGLGDDVLVELGPPRLDGRGLGEADHVLLVLGAGSARGQVGGDGEARHGGAGHLDEFTTFHLRSLHSGEVPTRLPAAQACRGLGSPDLRAPA